MKSALKALLRVVTPVLRPIVRSMCFLFTFLPLSANRVALSNLQKQMPLPRRDARRVVTGLYFHYVSYFVELLILWPLGLIEFTNVGAFGALAASVRKRLALEDRQGFFMLAGHYSNIEASGLAIKNDFRAEGIKPFYVIAKPAKYAFAERLLVSLRQGRGFLVLTTGNDAFIGKMREAMSTGFSIAALVDQKPRRGGSFVPFFSEEACFPDKGILLAIENNMAFLHLTLRRRSIGVFDVIFEEGHNGHLERRQQVPGTLTAAASPSDPDAKATCEAVLRNYTRWLENVIRTEPSQWSWDYRKWTRKRPVETVNNGAS